MKQLVLESGDGAATHLHGVKSSLRPQQDNTHTNNSTLRCSSRLFSYGVCSSFVAVAPMLTFWWCFYFVVVVGVLYFNFAASLGDGRTLRAPAGEAVSSFVFIV